MLVRSSKQMDKFALSILEKASSGYFDIHCLLYSPSDTTLQLIPEYIDQFTIVQRYHSDYTDNIRLVVELNTQDTLALLKAYKNLKCRLELIRLRKDTWDTIDELDPLIYDYRVIISNSSDLLKMFNINEISSLENEEPLIHQRDRRFSIELQLIEDEVYHVRNKQINGLLKSSNGTPLTVQSALYFVVNCLGIKNAVIVPPDNRKVWKTINIPPMQDISTVFDYLQDWYGVYAKGLSYYFTNGIFYLYPAYETNPSTDRVAHIYNTPAMSYSGHHGYHYIDDKGLVHILCNTEVVSTDMTEKGIENVGNFRLSLRTDMALDVNRDLTLKSGKFSDNNILGCGGNLNRGMVENTQKARYDTSSNNAYVMASEIAEYNCTILASTWMMAEPYLLQPGQKIYYHYDKEDVFSTVRGIVEEIVYTTQNIGRQRKYIYTTNATYALRLEPNEI